MSDKIVAVKELRKTYVDGLIWRNKVEALRGVSLEVDRGEIFGLIGPNGAGKTTLIKVLLGLVRKTDGEATLLGHPAGDRNARLKVGYLPEGHRIPHHLTGNTAMEVYGRLSHLSMSEINQRRPVLLEKLGLQRAADRKVSGYSKGMLQRLGLAQAMLHEPDLLILDEPTDGVDPKGRADIRRFLAELKSQGKSIFINSHQLQELEMICDRVAMLERGKLLYAGGVKEVTGQADTAQSEVVLFLHGSEAAITKALDPNAVVEGRAENRFEVRLPIGDQEAIDKAVDALRAAKISIASLTRRQRTLEQAYLDMVDIAEKDD